MRELRRGHSCLTHGAARRIDALVGVLFSLDVPIVLREIRREGYNSVDIGKWQRTISGGATNSGRDMVLWVDDVHELLTAVDWCVRLSGGNG